MDYAYVTSDLHEALQNNMEDSEKHAVWMIEKNTAERH